MGTGLCNLPKAWLMVSAVAEEGGKTLWKVRGRKVCFQCVRLAEIAFPSLAHEICMLGWWYWFFWCLLLKQPQFLSFFYLYGIKSLPSTLETTGICCTSVLCVYHSVIFMCALMACLSRCLPSNQFSSHHSMTGTCYIPGMSTGICFHVAGNECQDFHMMKQKGGGYVF